MRFPEFKGEWEVKKLGEVAEFKVTNSFSRDNLNYENGTVKNIHYGDIHTKFQTLFDITKETVPYINEEISINRISEDSYCKEGDIVFADASEDLNDVGKSIEILNLNNEKLLSGLHTLLARPRANYFQIGFNGYLFKSNTVRLQIQKESQGSKVLSINVGRISNVKLSFPSFSEQQKITSLLSLVDDRIQTQSKIIENLKTLINATSEKLFTRKLRFKDDIGNDFPDWKNKLGSEVFDSITNKKHNSDLPILAITQEHGAIPRDLIDYQISVTNKSIKSYKVVEIDDFIISLRSFQGGIEYSNYKGICSPAYIILRNKIEIDNRFYKYYLKTDSYIKLLNKKLEGIRDGKMISYAYFSEINLSFPFIEEQTKIARFLSSIDDKIKIERKILEQLETQKKYLLSNLFI
ncbi:restriction endonuclease subunit S [Flavobacterium sp. FBOR7N2.3]|uniref:Restriction endonuclease subunit S n=1 Tax=Flavobacterium magnesitis TaxID=3138077 RepID=A0ABV4TLS9_9FLAO